MNTQFSGKPDPDFMSKPETRRALGDAITKAGVFGRGWTARQFGVENIGAGPMRNIRGMSEPVAVSPETEEGIKAMVASKVLDMHRANPRIAPQHLVDAALEATLASTAVIKGEVVMDPYGNDLYSSVFGTSDAQKYRDDPTAIGTAIDQFVGSAEFADTYVQGVDLAPVLGFWDYVGAMQESMAGSVGLGEGLSTDNQRMLYGSTVGTPVYSARVVGQDKILLDFTLSKDQPPLSVVVPLSAVGDFYKKTTKQQLTQP